MKIRTTKLRIQRFSMLVTEPVTNVAAVFIAVKIARGFEV